MYCNHDFEAPCMLSNPGQLPVSWSSAGQAVPPPLSGLQDAATKQLLPSDVSVCRVSHYPCLFSGQFKTDYGNSLVKDLMIIPPHRLGVKNVKIQENSDQIRGPLGTLYNHF